MLEIDKIYNEDMLVGMKRIPDESIDLVVTDCPYHIVSGGANVAERSDLTGGMLGKRRAGVTVTDEKDKAIKTGKLFGHNDIEFSDWLPEVYRVLKKGTHCYIMINSRNIKELQTEAEKAGFVFQNLLVWDKQNSGGTPNKFYMQKCEFILMLSKRPARYINDMGTSNLLSCPNIIGKDGKHHPTEKPSLLMSVFIRNSSRMGEIVLDPFAGSGSTLVAARQLERHYIGFEIDKQYYDLAKGHLDREGVQGLLF